MENGWEWGKNGDRKVGSEALAPVQTREDVPWAAVMEAEIRRCGWIWGRAAKRLEIRDEEKARGIQF